ncbi:unnamed protein product [Pedinophyceae sp. YPF-701]|nr:unnamed protein product [Pedinophyceae sp. YPF-701]
MNENNYPPGGDTDAPPLAELSNGSLRQPHTALTNTKGAALATSSRPDTPSDPTAQHMDDAALAAMLQEQENAWMDAGPAGSTFDHAPRFALPAHGAGAAGAQAGVAREDIGGAGGGAPGASAADAARSGRGSDGVDSASDRSAGAGDAEALTDEELARRLWEEERRQYEANLLALAGAGPAAAEVHARLGITPDDGEEDSGDEPAAVGLDVERLSYEQLLELGEVVGSQSRGAAAAAIAELRELTWGDEECRAAVGRAHADGAGAGADEDEEEQCAVCRMEYEVGDGVRLLTCGHVFHSECIAQWLGINRACPICGKDAVEAGGAAA